MIIIQNKGSNTIYIETSELSGVGFAISIDEAKSIIQATKKENFLDNGISFFLEEKIVRFAFGGSHRVVVDLEKQEFLTGLKKVLEELQ